MGILRKSVAVLPAVLLIGAGIVADAATDRVEQIVARSVENTNADWAAAPRFDFTEHDVISDSTRTIKTYQVLMIEGSPYNKAISINGQPLSPAQAANEERKLQQEITRRRNESAYTRQKRLADYEKQRRQDRDLMQEMVRAFNFKLVGEETVDGRRCFALRATPRPGYVPPTRDTKALTGMRGEMWIDMQQYQWVKVHAEVFRPVAFGLFIAHVEPGTEFTLEQKPVSDKIWLPSHFLTRVKAEILIFSRHSSDDETYWDYHPATQSTQASAR